VRRTKKVFKVRVAVSIRIINFAGSCRCSFQIGMTRKLNDIERNVASVLVASCAENVVHRGVALKFS